MKTSRRLLFALVPLILLVILFELGLRIANWPQSGEGFQHDKVFWVSEADLKNKAMPHREEAATFPVSTNGDGLRTRYTAEHKEGRTRVMTLGCSTTFGWGVADHETYASRLEELFRQDGLDVEVVNGGQPGYTTFQGIRLWDQVLSAYKPDVVLVGYIVQDARKAAFSDKSQAILQEDNKFLKENVLYRWKTYLFMKFAFGNIQVSAIEQGGQDEGGAFRVPPSDYEDNLRELVGKIQAQGADVVLFGFPLEVEGYTKKHREILKSLADDLDVGYFDPQEKMIKAARLGQLYFPNDRGHPNADGNAQIAEWVYSFLRDYRTDW